MKTTLLIHVPGLDAGVAGRLRQSPALAPHLTRYATRQMSPIFPAVTCTVQASLTTGATPTGHGITANGLPTYLHPHDADDTDPSNHVHYRRQVAFWEQSAGLVESPKWWQGQPIKTAMLFMQQSMPSWRAGAAERGAAADLVITPKPEHGPNGNTASRLWSTHAEIVQQLEAELGPFPLHRYWGPMAGIAASEWIALATRRVLTSWQPDDRRLIVTYLPHLDYDFQRFGPESPQAARAVDEIATLLAAFFEDGHAPWLVGEYAIEPVGTSVAPNRLLREAGFLRVKSTDAGAEIDYQASRAWALCDHQAVHAYVPNPTDRTPALELLLGTGLLEEVPSSHRIGHRRAGQLQMQTTAGAWCDYRWWTDPADAPRFATSVDIHAKPGYDPLELFFDERSAAALQVMMTAGKGGTAAGSGPKTAGPVLPPPITQNAALVRGSHGRIGLSVRRAVLLAPPSAYLPSDTQNIGPTDYAGAALHAAFTAGE